MTMNDVRQFFMNSDGNGIELLSVAVYSLLKHNNPDHPAVIYLAHDKTFVERGCKARIDEIVARFAYGKVVYLDYSPCAEEYGKLFQPMLWAFPLCEKILPRDVRGTIVYIDIDMLILSDLGELFELDLRGKGMIAAAVNESRREHRQYLIDAGWPEEAGYAFNNATTVLDLDAFREQGLSDKMIAWQRKYWKTAACLDQDAQNVAYGAQTLRLPPKWNYTDGWLERLLKHCPFAKEWRVFNPKDVVEAILKPKIIHYIGHKKPNRPNRRPERKIYLKYMREIGLLTTKRLPGESFGYHVSCLFADFYHALLKIYARVLYLYL